MSTSSKSKPATKPIPSALDEVEIVTPDTCALCHISLAGWRLPRKQEHYEKHFDEKPTKEPLSNAASIPDKAKSPQKRKKRPLFNSDTFSFDDKLWLSTYESRPPPNQHPGFIPLLKKALVSSHERGQTQRAFLCYAGIVYVTVQGRDLRWGCGYRNYMMACSALMHQQFQPMYFPLLDSKGQPGVRELQQSIELAWSEGFDQIGAKQLDHKLLNSKKWIGTADIWVAYTHKGIPTQLVDFYCKKSSKGLQMVTDWIVEYFGGSASTSHGSNVNDVLLGATAVTCTDKMPLILQHQGHSRTVVGYELTKRGSMNLLIFDPSLAPNKDLCKAANEVHFSQRQAKPPTPSRSSQEHRGICEFFKGVPKALTGHKRGADEVDIAADPSSSKRLRPQLDDDEVVVIEESPTIPAKQKPSSPKKSIPPTELLKHFRLDVQKLGRNDEYQILYFPMTDPLTDDQRLSKRIVTSIRLE